MNKEVKDFAEEAKKRMLGWSETIDDPHSRVYARAFCSIVDECVDVLEYEQKKRKMIEIADKLSLMGYRIVNFEVDNITIFYESNDPINIWLEPRKLTYEEAAKLAERKK